MYPLKFENIYFDKIWGGNVFKKFRDNVPKGNIGESWDVACHPNGNSIILNGKFKGLKLSEIINLKGNEIIGTKISKKDFPLLVKLISAKSKLSVQVHPSHKKVEDNTKEIGKNEIWYVIDSNEKSKLVLGTKDCTKQELQSAVNKGQLDKYLNKVKVKKGDVYFIKSGLIHAIGEDVLILEIQNNSDITYRLYDYNRGRKLHIKEALEVIDLDLKVQKSLGLKVEHDGYSKTYYCMCESLALELYDIKRSFSELSDKERFCIFTCVEGKGEVIYKQGIEEIKIGDSLLIPASLGKYEVKGKVKLLKSYVPNIEKNKKEILNLISY